MTNKPKINGKANINIANKSDWSLRTKKPNYLLNQYELTLSAQDQRPVGVAGIYTTRYEPDQQRNNFNTNIKILKPEASETLRKPTARPLIAEKDICVWKSANGMVHSMPQKFDYYPVKYAGIF